MRSALGERRDVLGLHAGFQRFRGILVRALAPRDLAAVEPGTHGHSTPEGEDRTSRHGLCANRHACPVGQGWNCGDNARARACATYGRSMAASDTHSVTLSLKHLGLFLTAALTVLLLSCASAFASPRTFTWSGADVFDSPNWSDTTTWIGSAPDSEVALAAYSGTVEPLSGSMRMQVPQAGNAAISIYSFRLGGRGLPKMVVEHQSALPSTLTILGSVRQDPKNDKLGLASVILLYQGGGTVEPSLSCAHQGACLRLVAAEKGSAAPGATHLLVTALDVLPSRRPGAAALRRACRKGATFSKILAAASRRPLHGSSLGGSRHGSWRALPWIVRAASGS